MRCLTGLPGRASRKGAAGFSGYADERGEAYRWQPFQHSAIATTLTKKEWYQTPAFGHS